MESDQVRNDREQENGARKTRLAIFGKVRPANLVSTVGIEEGSISFKKVVLLIAEVNSILCYYCCHIS